MLHSEFLLLSDYYFYWEMLLPELRCKQDHMFMSIVWILFSSKCEEERWKTNREKRKGKTKRVTHRLRRKIITLPVDPVASHWYPLLLDFSVGMRGLGGLLQNIWINIQWINTCSGIHGNVQAPALWGKFYIVFHSTLWIYCNALDHVQSSGGRPQKWACGALQVSFTVYDNF